MIYGELAVCKADLEVLIALMEPLDIGQICSILQNKTNQTIMNIT